MAVDLLYKCNNASSSNDFNEKYMINECPILRGLGLYKQSHNLEILKSAIYFGLLTKGKGKIVYVTDASSGALIHTSFLIPQCSKFQFLKKNDYEIGPCKTDSKYRGQGIYPKVLKYIVNKYSSGKNTFYMIVDQKNSSSRKGCEKAGFTISGTVERNQKNKNWNIRRNENEY